MGLVDEITAPAKFAALVQERAQKLAAGSTRGADATGIRLNALKRKLDDAGYHYEHVDVMFDRAQGQQREGARSARRSTQ